MAERAAQGGRRNSYHHGDLKRALVDSALQIIAERGMDGLSVAEAARRAGVSPGAPYRHFASAAHLLAAAATRVGRELAADLKESGLRFSDDTDRLVQAAGVYVRFLVRRRAGFDLIFAVELEVVADEELREVGRAVMDELVPSALGVVGGDARRALELVEQIVVAAHGYGLLYPTGFLRSRAEDVDELARRAATLAQDLVRGAALLRAECAGGRVG